LMTNSNEQHLHLRSAEQLLGSRLKPFVTISIRDTS
jgi:hypothetical protein